MSKLKFILEVNVYYAFGISKIISMCSQQEVKWRGFRKSAVFTKYLCPRFEGWKWNLIFLIIPSKDKATDAFTEGFKRLIHYVSLSVKDKNEWPVHIRNSNFRNYFLEQSHVFVQIFINIKPETCFQSIVVMFNVVLHS